MSLTTRQPCNCHPKHVVDNRKHHYMFMVSGSLRTLTRADRKAGECLQPLRKRQTVGVCLWQVRCDCTLPTFPPLFSVPLLVLGIRPSWLHITLCISFVLKSVQISQLKKTTKKTCSFSTPFHMLLFLFPEMLYPFFSFPLIIMPSSCEKKSSQVFLFRRFLGPHQAELL